MPSAVSQKLFYLNLPYYLNITDWLTAFLLIVLRFSCVINLPACSRLQIRVGDATALTLSEWTASDPYSHIGVD